MYKVAILSKTPLYGAGIASVIPSGGRVQVVSTSSTPKDLVALAKEHGAQVLVIDTTGLTENEGSFIEGSLSYSGAALLALTDPTVESGGALSFDGHTSIPRTCSASELHDAVWTVCLGLPEAITVVRGRGRPRNLSNPFHLSNREYDVAQLIAKGNTNKQIADTLGMQDQSVKNLVSTVTRKMGCANRVQVALALSKEPAAPLRLAG